MAQQACVIQTAMGQLDARGPASLCCLAWTLLVQAARGQLAGSRVSNLPFLGYRHAAWSRKT